MNKQKYLDKLYKNQISKSAIFKKIVMVCPNDQYKIILNKVFDVKLIGDYIAPLIEYYDEGYLIKPINKISFKNFTSDIDILVIDASMKVIFSKESAWRSTLNFDFDFHSVIILPKGLIRLTKLKIGDKIKFKTLLSI